MFDRIALPLYSLPGFGLPEHQVPYGWTAPPAMVAPRVRMYESGPVAAVHESGPVVEVIQ